MAGCTLYCASLVVLPLLPFIILHFAAFATDNLPLPQIICVDKVRIFFLGGELRGKAHPSTSECKKEEVPIDKAQK